MRESLTQKSYNRIKEDILSHRLLPREPLREAELAARYETSKTPVREALLILTREGIVEMHAFRGMRVRDFSTQDVREVYELREILEPLAIERAIPRMTQEDTEGLRDLLRQAWEAVERGDERELSRLNREFHTALVARCDNSRILEILAQLQNQVRVMTLRFWRVRATYLDEARQHEEILSAAAAGNTHRAADLLRAHIVQFRKRHLRELDEQAPEQLIESVTSTHASDDTST
jgi:DNA-binding GntR family transcriptional regulator